MSYNIMATPPLVGTLRFILMPYVLARRDGRTRHRDGMRCFLDPDGGLCDTIDRVAVHPGGTATAATRIGILGTGLHHGRSSAM